MRKRYLVFSIYSTALENYPYKPFLAKNVNDAIVKFISFLRNKKSVCEGAELHLIGKCEQCKDSDLIENIQAFLLPQRVEIKENFYKGLVICGFCFYEKIENYLNELERSFKNGFRKERKTRKSK
jgi:hypothetical protein